MRTNIAAALALVFLSSLVWTGCHSPKPASTEKPLVVQLTTVQRRTLPDILELSGIVNPQPNQSAKVAAIVPGVLTKVGPQVGDWVQRNQEVAQLQQSIQNAQVEQAQAGYQVANANWLKAQRGSRPQEIVQARATLESANAALLNAQKNRTRMQKLLQENIAAGKDVDLAISQERTALAQVQVARANLSLVLKGPRREDRMVALQQAQQAKAILNQAKANLNFTRITSPITGIVAERYLNIGDQAGPTTPIFLIVNPQVVLVQANLPVGYHEKVAIGDIVTILPPDETQTFPGKVISIGIKVDPITNTVPVQVQVLNNKQVFKIGMAVKTRIVLSEHYNTLVVPKKCLISSSEHPNQYQVNRVIRGVSIATMIKPGILTDTQAEVLAGLKEGDQLICDIGYELPANTPVTGK